MQTVSSLRGSLRSCRLSRNLVADLGTANDRHERLLRGDQDLAANPAAGFGTFRSDTVLRKLEKLCSMWQKVIRDREPDKLAGNLATIYQIIS